MSFGRLARWIGVLGGALGGAVLGYAMVLSAGIHQGRAVIITLTAAEGLVFGYLAAPYVQAAAKHFDRRLKTTPLPDLIAGILGLILGLVVAVLIGFFVREFPYGVGLSTVLAVLLGIMGANTGLTRRAELVALLTGPQAPPEDPRRLRSALLDTSLIIDGRILDVARTGFVDWALVVPRCVLHELQHVADSADATRRNRGRRGLDVLTQMQEEGKVRLEFTEDDPPGDQVDAKLVRLAKQGGHAILTTDFNLNRVARLEGVPVLNLNDLAHALRPIAIPGEELELLVMKEGKEPGQGIAYLNDGTMVVIENGRRYLNQTITTTVTSVLQTAAGRMIFAQPRAGLANGRAVVAEPGPAPSRASRPRGGGGVLE